MNEYYFIYKNSTGLWCSATNPMFIAKHTYCRAFPKTAFDNLNILPEMLNKEKGLLSQFIYLLNYEDKIENQEIIDFINLFELY